MVLLINLGTRGSFTPSSNMGRVLRFVERSALSFRQPTDTAFLVETDQDAWWWLSRLREHLNSTRDAVWVWELASGNQAGVNADAMEWLQQRLPPPAAPSDVTS